MREIKFSHRYTKFDGIDIENPVALLEVFNSHKEHLSENFIMYDTLYRNGDDFATYNLNSMPVIILLLIDKNGKIFTTVRRWTSNKETYYRDGIGEEFRIVIKIKGI